MITTLFSILRNKILNSNLPPSTLIIREKKRVKERTNQEQMQQLSCRHAYLGWKVCLSNQLQSLLPSPTCSSLLCYCLFFLPFALLFLPKQSLFREADLLSYSIMLNLRQVNEVSCPKFIDPPLQSPKPNSMEINGCASHKFKPHTHYDRVGNTCASEREIKALEQLQCMTPNFTPIWC